MKSKKPKMCNHLLNNSFALRDFTEVSEETSLTKNSVLQCRTWPTQQQRQLTQLSKSMSNSVDVVSLEPIVNPRVPLLFVLNNLTQLRSVRTNKITQCTLKRAFTTLILTMIMDFWQNSRPSWLQLIWTSLNLWWLSQMWTKCTCSETL
jgi:hypothetical protein